MKRKYLACILLACSGSALAQGPKLVEKVVRKGDEVVIPYEKYVLGNGLTVILAEDHSDPIVHVDVSYHVGSAREEIGKSGFAHFFEHMMFEGSDHVKSGDHFKIVSASGGEMNGTTNADKTHYFETVPSNQLEKMLWLESDRMGFLLDAVTGPKFEIQRATVKNERGQNYDNRPYGLSFEAFSKALFPYGHPYSWLTIGYVADLDRVDVGDLKRFFLRWYGPNNATLTIGGDINVKQTLAWVEKYFGLIPRGPEVSPTVMQAPLVEKERFVSYQDSYARLPMLCVVYPGVRRKDKDEKALDAFATIIGQGTSSPLSQLFIKGRQAVNASMFSYNQELAGMVIVQVLPYPQVELAKVKRQVDSLLNAFEKRGVTDEDIARYKGPAEAGIINSLASVQGKVNMLAEGQLFNGTPNQAGAELAAVRKVTKEDVMRVFRQYIKGHAAVCLSVLPKDGHVQPAAPDNYIVDSTYYKSPDYGYEGLAYHKAKDNFDRSAEPPAGPNPVVKVPVFWTGQLPNGIRIIGSKNDEIPTVTINMEIKGGPLWANRDSSKAGLAMIVSHMLNESTQHHTAEDISAALERMGSEINVNVNNTGIALSISCLKKNLDATLALLKERLFAPKFTVEAFDRVKEQTLENFQMRQSQASALANSIFNQMLYAPGNFRPYALNGTAGSLASIQLKDVEGFYRDHFAPEVTSISVVGDIDKAQMDRKLAFLKDWAKKGVVVPAADSTSRIAQSRTIYFVDIPHAAQSEIRVGYITNINYDATGLYYRLGLMNYPLGGAFTSRLNLELREVKGWTYGASSYFTSGEYGGSFAVHTGVKTPATDSAVASIINVIRDYAQGGITTDELAFTRHSIGQGDALKYETNDQKAEFLADIQKYHLTASYVDEQQRILSTISPKEINRLARSYLDTQRMTIVVVGDKQAVMAGLKGLGYSIIELDVNGRIR